MSDKTLLKAKEKEHYALAEEKIKEFNCNGKLTVAIFIDAFFPTVDGVVMVVDNIAKRLNKKCNVVVVAPKCKGQTITRDYLVIGAKSVYFKQVNYNAALFKDGKVRKLLKNLRIDVLHAHSPFFLGKLAKSIHNKRRIPLVCSFHSQYKKDIYKATKSKLLTKIVLSNLMSVFSAADETWTMHYKSAETLKSYGYKGKIAYMTNATDYVYPENAESIIESVKEKYGLKNKTVFLFVGRLIVQKNILFTVEVLSELRKKGLDFYMFFIGEGPDREILCDKINELGLKNNVALLGNISDKEIIKSFYLTADLMLFPSKYDVSSIVQIEAAAMKTPCAFVEDSVTSYTVQNGVNGLILPENVKAFADGVYGFIKDEKLKSQLSENAYRDLYVTWDDIVDKTYNRYVELVEEYKNKNEK